MHDALCVIRCLVHKRFMIAGGAAAEVEVATQLSRWAKTLVVSTSVLCLVSHSMHMKCSGGLPDAMEAFLRSAAVRHVTQLPSHKCQGTPSISSASETVLLLAFCLFRAWRRMA